MSDPGDIGVGSGAATVPRRRRARLRLDVVREAGDWAAVGDAKSAVRAAAKAVAACQRLRFAPAVACVALADEARVRELNRTFRGKDKATNVLSFPAVTTAVGEGAHRSLGDVVLACETVLREAALLGIPPQHHLQHLVVHGLLHLLGHDHDNDRDADAMEALEVEILAALGVPDPYVIAAHAAAD